jgi:pimeloyl-ACP methyl ester carboxylesterase
VLSFRHCSGKYVRGGRLTFISVEDLEVNYELIGSGDALVLIMGLTGSLDWWDPVFLSSLADHHRVLVFDNRGGGRTVTPEEGEITCPQMADDTAGLMDALGIERAHVLGLSMGGMIAQELALNHAERVDRLVLCSTNCGRSGSVFATREVLKKLAERTGTPEAQVENFCSLTFCADWLESHSDEVEEFTERYLRSPATDRNADRQFQATVTFDACARIPGIDRPTLVACGTDDIIIPPENSRIIAGRIPGAKLLEYEGAGHGFIWERRDEFLSDLLGFLDGGG